MRILSVFLTLSFSFLFLNCDDSTSNSNAGDPVPDEMVGKWIPDSYRMITWDDGGNQKFDSSLNYCTYMAELMEADTVELLMEMKKTEMIGHLKLDSIYVTDPMGILLDGKNVKGEIYLEVKALAKETGTNISIYECYLEDGEIVFHEKATYTDPNIVSQLGYKEVEAWLRYKAYNGEIPPSHWPAPIRSNKINFAISSLLK